MDEDFLIEKQQWLNNRRFLQSNADEIERTIREVAAVMRKAFLGLTAAGFDEEQALSIVKARGPFLA